MPQRRIKQRGEKIDKEREMKLKRERKGILYSLTDMNSNYTPTNLNLLSLAPSSRISIFTRYSPFSNL